MKESPKGPSTPVDKEPTPAELEKAKRTDFLGHGPLGATIWKLTWPDFIGKVINALYTIVDAAFIGRLAGDRELAAASFAMPLDQFFHLTLGLLVGVGCGTVYGKYLGSKDTKNAKSVVGNMFFLTIAIGVLYPLIVIWFVDPLLRLTGASEATGTLSLARDYFVPLVYACILQISATGLSNVIRAEGSAMFSASLMAVGAVTNTCLDPIFIRVFGWGVQGAAISTVCSFVASTALGIYYFASGKSAIHLELRDLAPNWTIIKEVLNVGMSGAVSAMSQSLVVILLNNMILQFIQYPVDSYHATQTIAVAGALGKINFFCLMPQLALAHGVLPILAYSRGSKNYGRFTSCMKVQFYSEVVLGVVLTLIGAFGGTFVSGLFSTTPYFHVLFTEGMRLITAGTVFTSVSMMLFPALQTSGKGWQASVVLFMRQLAFIYVCALLFCNLLGDWWGVFYAYASGEVLSAVLSGCMYLYYKKDFAGGGKKNY